MKADKAKIIPIPNKALENVVFKLNFAPGTKGFVNYKTSFEIEIR
jgi:hypothetical protein